MKKNRSVGNTRGKSNPRYDIIDPPAAAMIESLRAFGYTLPSAIADLIDNSISAGARNIWLKFEWDGSNSFISITDDGQGMSSSQLVKAMRPGSQNPLDDRAPSDLGRYGLGLKTASFSQCRRMTVCSQRDGGRKATRCWDLDYVNHTGEWRLLSDVKAETRDRLTQTNFNPSGTVVLWELLDRLVSDTETEDQAAQQRFLEMVDDVESHLSMVFHRFMTSRHPLRIYINGNDENSRVKPWDPFMENHSACQSFPSEKIPFKGTMVDVTGFVLPHHDKLDKSEFEDAAGPNNWNAHQGFYVYRNKRLLVPGDWLGFGFAKEEHYKLARIRIDIPNSIDGEWNIDVKKSHARPPAPIRRELKRIASVIRKRAVEVYRHRGKTIARSASQPHVFLWKPVKRGKKSFYTVNREHPLVVRAMEVAGEDQGTLRALLRLLEETVPVEQIWLDKADAPDSHGKPFESAREKELVDIMSQVFAVLRREGFSISEARRRLLAMEAFADYPEIVATL